MMNAAYLKNWHNDCAEAIHNLSGCLKMYMEASDYHPQTTAAFLFYMAISTLQKYPILDATKNLVLSMCDSATNECKYIFKEDAEILPENLSVFLDRLLKIQLALKSPLFK